MKLWRASTIHAHDGTLLRWGASERAVRQLARNDFDAHCSKPVFEQIDIPTTKAGLVDWLNDHFNTDNG